MSFIDTVKKDINIAETWISSISSKVKAIFTKAEVLEPAIAEGLSALVTKTESFLAAATPAVVGEGLNFPADSVAYAAFEDLVAEFQSLASTLKADVKAVV
jgi:hypothetical protein